MFGRSRSWVGGGHGKSSRNIHSLDHLKFLVQFRQDKVCVKFIQGNQKNGSVPTCKRKNNRLLEVAVP